MQSLPVLGNATARPPGNLTTIAVIAMAWLMVSAAALSSLPSPRSGTSEPFVIVFPPWVSSVEAADAGLAAGYVVLRQGLWPFVLIAAVPDGERAPLARPVPLAKPAKALAMVERNGLTGCLDAAAQGNTPSS